MDVALSSVKPQMPPGSVAIELISTTLIVRNALAREGLRRILLANGYAVVHASADAATLSGCSWTSAHLLIIDGTTFEAAGLVAILEGLVDAEMPRIVIIGNGFDFDLMVRIFAAGAHGYLLDQESHHALLVKLALVLMGERVMPAVVVDTLCRPGRRTCAADARQVDTTMLDMRGQAVLAGLVNGLSNRMIAHELCLSELTVKTVVRTVLRKLCVTNRTQAALRAQGVERIQVAWDRSRRLKASGPRTA